MTVLALERFIVEKCEWSVCLSYLSCLSLKVHILSGGNLPLITVLVGWEELEREVGTCSYKGLEIEGKNRLVKSN